MAITIDWVNKVVQSTASILDLPLFHQSLRALEFTSTGVVYPVIHAWKALDLGGGAFFYQADLINGWQLKFTVAGNYTISGNLNATIIPFTGVYVERKTSSAYSTTTAGSGGPTPTDIAAAVWQRVVEAGFSAESLLRLLVATSTGNASGLDSPTVTFNSIDGTKPRVAGTVAGGVRSITTRDGS